MLEICQLSVQPGFTHFFYGGANGAQEMLKARLTARFPALQVVGTYEPPFRSLNVAEARTLQQQVAAVKPDILWVGLSTPKQEQFMAEYLPQLDTDPDGWCRRRL